MSQQNHASRQAQAQPIDRKNSARTREDCISLLSKGHALEELPDSCKELLGANSKVGLLARRNSAVGRVWNPAEGHNSRSYTESTFGAPTDNPKDDKSMGEIFLENRTPEEAEKIKKSIARTMSRGAKVRTDDVVTSSEVAKEAAEDQLKRRSSREKAH